MGLLPDEPTAFSSVPDHVLARYLSGESSAAERGFVEQWAAASPANRRTLAAMSAAWSARDVAADVDVEAQVAAALARTERPGNRTLAMRPAPIIGTQAPGRWRRAAWPLVVGAAGLVAVLAGSRLLSRSSNAQRGREVWSREYATHTGQRETVTLSDGTQFTLAPGSTLRLPADYAAGNRVVRLDGEAYFAVTHDQRHPFTVRAGNVTTVDVGTAFDIRAYAQDREIEVTVAEGSVGICRNTGRVLAAMAMPRSCFSSGAMRALTQGDRAVVSDTAIAVTHSADVGTWTSWTSGRLTFTRAPLSVVVLELSRWYGIEVRLHDPRLGAQEVSAAFTERAPQAALGALADALRLQVQQQGEVFTLSAVPSGGR